MDENVSVMFMFMLALQNLASYRDIFTVLRCRTKNCVNTELKSMQFTEHSTRHKTEVLKI